MEELLTAAETAQLLRCSLRTLDRERAVGNGCPFVRRGGRIVIAGRILTLLLRPMFEAMLRASFPAPMPHGLAAAE